MQFLHRDVESVQPARVHRRNIAHAENHDLRFPAGTAQCHVEILRRGEEERTFHPVKDDAIRDVFAAQTVCARGFGLAFTRDQPDLRDRFHLTQEQDDGHDHSRPHSNREVKNNRKAKGGRHHGKVRARPSP